MFGLKAFISDVRGMWRGNGMSSHVAYEIIKDIARSARMRCPGCDQEIQPHQIHVGATEPKHNGQDWMQELVVTHVSCAAFAPLAVGCYCASCDLQSA